MSDRWKKIPLEDGSAWEWRLRRGRVTIRDPSGRLSYHVPPSEITGDWDEDHEHRKRRERGAALPEWRLRSYVASHLAPPSAIEMPPVVFVHEHRKIETRRGSVDRWHMFWDCKFLARFRGMGDHALRCTPAEGERLLGKPLTRRNLCGVCMRFLRKKQAEETSP